MNLDPLKRLLARRLGLHFEGESESRLRSALDTRLAAVGGVGLADYLGRLREDAAEFQALAGLLTIQESYFYREPRHLWLLTEHLAPALLGGRGPGDPVRIFSVGCAAGEEPYSIVMALWERWGESTARRFRIEAADLDPGALARARAGRYRPWSLRGLAPVSAARWFAPAPGGMRELAVEIRRTVAFRVLNLVADPLPADLGGQDLIFYRNLSIYFDAATREAVLRRLWTLLRPGGYLIVGTAETLGNGGGPFTLCERDGVWYFQKEEPAPRAGAPVASGGAWPRAAGDPSAPVAGVGGDARRPSLSAAVSPRALEVPTGADPPCPPPAPPQRWGEGRYREALALAQVERFAAAAELLAPVCARPDAPAGALLLAALVLAETGDSRGAAAAADRVLVADPWSAPAQVLLGRLAHQRGDLEGAVAHLRRAVYASPDYWPAHFALAECRAAAGLEAAARREYRIVLRLLERDGAGVIAPLPMRLPLADLRLLCQARLTRLAESP